jgi:3-oxoacyl-[acyl-carrier-protein] synthase-3
MDKKSFILSCGSYLPKKILSNNEIAKTVETSHEWIVERTGIENRHIANDDETTSFMAIEAAKQAIARNPEVADKIDTVIVATTTPDQIFPATATKVQAALGLKKSCAFDIQAVCSGFLYALSVADSMIKSGLSSTILVIGADKMSKIVDWNDRGTCILFGDGAGAVILTSNSQQNNSGIIAAKLSADGDLGNILYTDGEVCSTKPSGHIVMNGREVFKHAVEKMSSSMEQVLASQNMTAENLDWVIPHQANSRIISAIGKKLNLPAEKIVITLQNQANTSAATIPLALNYHYNQGKLSRGDLIMLTAAGGGFTWGSMLLRW